MTGDEVPGGRLRTILLDGKFRAELGAQWIHGINNPLYKIAKQANMISEEISFEGEGIQL